MSDLTELLHGMHEADRSVIDRVGETLPAIAAAAEAIAARLEAGGRWFSAGAGTSGRIAALDAAELPPTFGTEPGLVRAVMAGGEEALQRAVEGAEDDADAGARDLEAAGLLPGDGVVGLAASGRTPWTLGAMRHAKLRGCLTVGVVCARETPLEAAVDRAIVVDVGPEVLAGSTRLKAGTAQKLVLNMLSTAVMARRGLVVRGEMVAMLPRNAKLRERAVRIVKDLTGVAPERALALLESSDWELPVALVRGSLGVEASEARRRLAAARGNVARVLGE